MNALFENAIDSLKVGMKFFMEKNEQSARKHAILTLFHSIELFLKEYLFRVNPILIYHDIDKKINDDSITVGIKDILIRLENLNKKLPKEEILIIEKMQKRRNRIEHHRYDAENEDKNTIAESLKFIIFFTEFCLEEKLSSHIESELQCEIQNLVLNNQDRYNFANINLNKWLEKKYPGWTEKISDIPDDFGGTLDCPKCTTSYLVVEEIEKPFCFWCNMEIDALECDICGCTYLRGNFCCEPASETIVSALLLNFYHEKQENYAAIFTRLSVDAANNALKAFANFIPLFVIWYLFCLGNLRMIP